MLVGVVHVRAPPGTPWYVSPVLLNAFTASHCRQHVGLPVECPGLFPWSPATGPDGEALVFADHAWKRPRASLVKAASRTRRPPPRPAVLVGGVEVARASSAGVMGTGRILEGVEDVAQALGGVAASEPVRTSAWRCCPPGGTRSRGRQRPSSGHLRGGNLALASSSRVAYLVLSENREYLLTDSEHPLYQ